jgi:SAM-dependent methyltransferase
MSGADADRWAAAAAALPTAERAARERSFWQTLIGAWGWRRVADAGCGAGFHLALLRDLGLEATGFDLSVAALPRGGAVAGDLLAPPLRPRTFDAALCLGNTLSLLADRSAQRRALAALAGMVRPGGVVVLQGEDTGALVRGGPVARTRQVEGGGVHVRVFERRGRRVRMLAGVAIDNRATLAEAWLVPTGSDDVVRMGRPIHLSPVELPARAPGSGVGWWVALSVRADAP